MHLDLLGKQRLALHDKQVSCKGEVGATGLYAVLFTNRRNIGSVDLRYFITVHNKKGMTLKSTRIGLILGSKRDVRAAIEALTEMADKWTELGLRDEEEEALNVLNQPMEELQDGENLPSGSGSRGVTDDETR